MSEIKEKVFKMGFRKDGRERGTDIVKEPSLATLDPFVKLAAATCSKALQDLVSSDPVRSLDALLWLISDGALWLQAVGFDVSQDDVFVTVIKELEYDPKAGRCFTTRFTSRKAAEYDQPGADAIPEPAYG